MTIDCSFPALYSETTKARAIVFNCYVNGLAIIRSLGRKGVHVIAVDYGKNALGFSSKYASECIIAPDPRVNEDELLSFLLTNSSKWAGSILIPTHDEELAIFSHHKEELSKYYIPAVPGWETIKKIVDKKETYEIAVRLNIPIPKTVSLDTVESLDSLQKNIGFPCLLKPRKGYEFSRKYGRKAIIIDNYEQLKKGMAEAYELGCEMMVQEFIPGKVNLLYKYMAYYDSESKPWVEFTHKKLRQEPSDLGVGRVTVSTHTEEIVAPSRKIFRELSFMGLCEIEYKKDPRDGEFKLLDINGRSIMQMGLPIRCGIDFPWIMYNDLVWNRELHVSEYKNDIMWIHETVDIDRAIRHPIREKLLTIDYILPYFAPKTFAVFARDDWKPVIKEWYLILRSLLTKPIRPCISAVRRTL